MNEAKITANLAVNEAKMDAVDATEFNLASFASSTEAI
jgi:hypothetical protein